jgi:phospholipid/cholesterol/gamma-HCH transport system substrate-binding protein
MESRAHALAAGLFAITLLIAAVAMFLWLTRDTTIRTRYILTAQGNVTGLKAQAPVRYKGLDVGSVESIEFDESRPGDILVYIRVNDETPITTRTVGELGMLGVTGLSFVQLQEPPSKPGVPRAPPRKREVPIPLQASLLERVADAGEALVAQSEEASRRVSNLLSDGRQTQFFAAIEEIGGAARKFGVLADELKPASRAIPQLAAQANKTLTNADRLVTDLRGVASTANTKLAQLDDTTGALREGALKIGQTADELRTATALVTATTVPHLNRLIADASRGSKSVARTLDELAANPQSVLFGAAAPTPGPGEPGFSFKDQK